jgi:hypothetical protein
MTGLTYFLYFIGALVVLYIIFRLISLAVLTSWNQVIYKRCGECYFYKLYNKKEGTYEKIIKEIVKKEEEQSKRSQQEKIPKRETPEAIRDKPEQK